MFSCRSAAAARAVVSASVGEVPWTALRVLIAYDGAAACGAYANRYTRRNARSARSSTAPFPVGYRSLAALVHRYGALGHDPAPVFSLLLTVILLIFVIPQFEEVFANFGAELPAFTMRTRDSVLPVRGSVEVS